MDRNFWNVISIHEAKAPRNTLHGAKRVHYVAFDDAEEACDKGGWVIARETDVARMFEFADTYPAEPLLIHCRAGVSRSTAVALGLIVRALCNSEDLVADSVEQLLAIRPAARPNHHVLRLALSCFLAIEEAEALAKLLVNHPILLSNRFLNPKGI